MKIPKNEIVKIALTSPEYKSVRQIVYLFALSRIIFVVILCFCLYVIKVPYDFGSVLYQYDGYYYNRIGVLGYNDENQYAFFPLFPLIVRGFSIIGSQDIGPVILNNIMALLVALLIYKIIIESDNGSESIGLSSARFWLFSPIAVTTCVLYTESLFVFLTILSYFLYKREKLAFSGVALGLSILTRSLGAMLFFSYLLYFFYQVVRQKRIAVVKDGLKLLVPAGVLGSLYPIYLQVKLGSWHYFMDVQQEYWARVKSNLVDIVCRDIYYFSGNPVPVIFTYISLFLSVWILANAIKGRSDPILIVYSALTLLAIFSSAQDAGTVASISFYRYIFGCVSIYLLYSNSYKSRFITFCGGILGIMTMSAYCFGVFLI